MIHGTHTRLLLAVLTSALLMFVRAGTALPERSQELSTAGLSGFAGVPLSPTLHPAVPEELASMWYASAGGTTSIPTSVANLAKGVRLLEQSGDAAAALPLVSAGRLASTDVAPYAQYYTGLALQRLNRLAEADTVLADVAAQEIPGYLPEAAALRRGEVREALKDYAGAEAVYETLVRRQLGAPEKAWLRLGLMAEINGRRARAAEAFQIVRTASPLSQEAAEADLGLARIDGFDLDSPDALARELTRAETLFKARRTSPARDAYERVRRRAEGDDRDLAALRLAVLDAQSGRARAARDVLRGYATHARHGAEAQFALLGVTRDLGDSMAYRTMVRSFVSAYPTSPLAAEALNDLATHYIRANEDAQAAEIFSEIVARYPAGRFTERAVWKAGWWAYRQRDYRETIRLFERGAASFPRSDYRPAWLYWSARAYDGAGERPAATERYRLTATDYLNTYYGRLAWKRLEARNEASVTPGIRRAVVTPPPPPPAADRIARLIEAELYHPALAELQHAQKLYGDSAPLQATIALVHNRLGNLRLGINAMKRAYPQYMTAGGENLPAEILQVIFPLDYWPMIQTLSQQHDLDPYLVAALVGQESTFDAGIVSSANAIGLMQVLPSTGKRYATKIGVARYSTARLTDAEVNARIGTRYLAELVRMFEGHAHYAIASYNAGETRVARWRRDKADLEQDEFIDDIPFPETQNYVKRILGTAEDYRRLYGEGAVPPPINRAVPGTSLGPGFAAVSKLGAKRPAAKKPAAKAPAKKPAAKKRAPKRG